MEFRKLEPRLLRLVLATIYGEGQASFHTLHDFPIAIDSEFLTSGKRKKPEDVHSFQIGSLGGCYFFDDKEELKGFLHATYCRKAKILYAFVSLPDIASLEEWGFKCRYWRLGSQVRARVKYGNFNAVVYDAQPLLHGFGLRNLALCGKELGLSKLTKPSFLGIRKWESEDEFKNFVDYACRDVFITSGIVRWLKVKFNADPMKHVSAGTLAGEVFKLPSRLKAEKGSRLIKLSPLEQRVKECCHAGRNEVFMPGYHEYAFYDDIKSLYPLAGVISKALLIEGVEECDPSEIYFGFDFEEAVLNYGWVEGVFKCDNDLWGLPIAGKNKIYMTGIIHGFFHSLDVCSAKAIPLYISGAWKPIFSKRKSLRESHFLAEKMLLERFDERTSKLRSKYLKAVKNSLWGKTGQCKPVISPTSNFFTYSSMLGCSHFIMSKVFDFYLRKGAKILGMDTDSVFNDKGFEGVIFQFEDFPVILERKGEGILNFFRSKRYIMIDPAYLKPEDLLGLKKFPKHGLSLARHNWEYPWEDYVKLFNAQVKELWTRKDIKHTLLTREKEAQKLARGRWVTKKVFLDEGKLTQLLSADVKRKRITYDSFHLIEEGKHISSKAWNLQDYLKEDKNLLELYLNG